MYVFHLEHCKLQIGCLLVILYLVFVYYKERRRFQFSGKITLYDILLGDGIICLLLDGITAYTVNHQELVNPTVNLLLHGLFLISIDALLGLMHTLFTLEDRYGLKIDEADGEVCLKIDVRKNKDAAELHKMLCAWRQVAAMLKAREITQEEYDRWRYHYPEFDTTQRWAKVPSQELSDMLIEALKEGNE